MTHPAPGVPSAVALDPEDPWPGLEAYRECDGAFFFGRDAESDELLRLVLRDRLTILFGLSGLGKTSLLRAALFPRLREADIFPVAIRLDHRSGVGLIDQVRVAIESEAKAAGVEAPPCSLDETLWECFHRKDAVFWGRRNRPVIPLLLFDQFEEVFTLGRSAPGPRDATAAFLRELADLIEGRRPAAVAARLDASPSEADRFVYRRHDYKVLLSLREDFLAVLEGLRESMPSVAHGRMRLQRMNGEQALHAVMRAGGRLIPPDDGGAGGEGLAQRIVRFVGGSPDAAGAGDSSLSRIVVESALLSLVCRELNQKRRQRGEPRITATLLEGNRAEILAQFYERSVADEDPAVRGFIEERLLTTSGYRESVALESALSAPGVTSEAISRLVDRRLLRTEDRGGLQRVEISHDVLTGVIRASRDKRRESEEQARLQEERRKQQETERRARLDQETRERRVAVAGEAQAERAFKRGLVAVKVAWVILLLFYLYAFIRPKSAETVGEMVSPITMVAPVVINSAFGVSFAGRALWALVPFIVFAEPPKEPWNSDTFVLAFLVFALPFVLAIGWGFDLAAANPLRARWLTPSLAIVVAGIIVASTMMAEPGNLRGRLPSHVADLAGVAIVFAWPWVDPFRKRARLPPDLQVLVAEACRMWLKRQLGRILALAIVLAAWLVYAGYGEMKQRLAALPDHVVTDASGQVYYWPALGQFLSESDIRGEQLYSLPVNQLDPALLQAIDADVRKLQGNDVRSQVLFEALSKRLAPYRIHTSEHFILGVGQENLAIHAGSGQARATRDDPAGYKLFYIDVPQLWRFSKEERETLIRGMETMQWPLAAFTVVAFLFAWRRGSDSPVARWVAVALAGQVALPWWYEKLYLPDLRYDLWRAALANHSLYEAAATGLETLSRVLWFLADSGIAFNALWVHLCWPARSRPRSAMRRGLGFASRLALVSAALAGLWWAASRAAIALAPRVGIDPAQAGWSGRVTALVITTAVALLAGAWLRRSRAQLTEVPVLGWSLIGAWLTVVCILAVLNIDPMTGAVLFSLRVPLTLIFGVLVTHAILRLNLLGVGGGGGVRSALLVSLPWTFELAEGAAASMLRESPFSSATATTFLALALVGATFYLAHLAEQWLAPRLADRRLARPGDAVRSALEAEADAGETPGATAAGRRQVGEAVGAGALVYLRGPDGAFHLLNDVAAAGAPPDLVVSGRLQRHLAQRGETRDLGTKRLEWEDLFFRTEMLHLAHVTGSRYLRPIGSGGRLEGFLFVPETASRLS
jgi:hypothetical protein